MAEETDAGTREIIERDAYAHSLGAEIIEIEQGRAKVRLELEPSHRNFMGMIHGGVIFSLADVAFGAAANSFGTRAMALSVSIDFLEAADVADVLTGEVELVKRAGKMGFYRMEVMGSEGNCIAKCHGWAYHTGKPL